MSFLNLLRGGVDTAGRVRAAAQQTEEQQLPFLVQLAHMQQAQARQQTMDQATLAHLGAETKKLGEPILREVVGPDGSVQFVDPTHPPPDLKAHIPPTPRDPVATHQANRQYDIDHPLPTRPTTGESPDVASTRKDLKDIQGQQIRAEHQVQSLKGEQRAFGTSHPRALRGLPAAKTAADSAAVQQLNQIGTGIQDAETRAQRLTHSADSTLNVLHQKRSAPVTKQEDFSGVDSGASTGTGAIDPDSITDAELAAATTAGAKTPEQVIAHVTAHRAKRP